MPTTRRPGTELESRATFGGQGYKSRAGDHRGEVADGIFWTRCGVSSEVAPLREVLLAEPGPELLFDDPPDRWLMLERVDLEAIRDETAAIAAYYESHGVAVHRFRPAEAPPPNFLFMRDLFAMTPEGAVLSRMGVQQRAGEERGALQALASLGIPLIATVRGEGTFEGADALWLGPSTVLVGVGRRTNRAGFMQVKRVLRDQGVAAIGVRMPRGVQHLLGIVNFVAADCAVVRRDKLPGDLRRLLASREVRLIELESTPEMLVGRAMNFVTLAPRHVVMPAGCPQTRERLEREGISCDEVRVDQYLRAAGGLGCLTGILRRGA